MDRGRESQDCNAACSSMPERDGKDQREGSPKQARSCWFARHCWLVLAALRPPYCISLTFFRWISRLFIHVCSFLSRHAFRPPITVPQQLCCPSLFLFLFFFCFIFYLLFPSISYMDRVATTAVSFSEWFFLLCDHGLDFWDRLMWEFFSFSEWVFNLWPRAGFLRSAYVRIQSINEIFLVTAPLYSTTTTATVVKMNIKNALLFAIYSQDLFLMALKSSLVLCLSVYL